MDEDVDTATHNVGALLAALATQLGNSQHSLEQAWSDLEDLRAAIAYERAEREKVAG